MRMLVRIIIFPLAGQRQEVRLAGGWGAQGRKKIRQGSSYPCSSLRTMTVRLNRRLVKRFGLPLKTVKSYLVDTALKTKVKQTTIIFFKAGNYTTRSKYKFNLFFFLF